MTSSAGVLLGVVGLLAAAVALAVGLRWRASGRAAATGATRLAAEKERVRDAVAAAGDGVWDWDLGSRRVAYSPGWKALLGLADADVGQSLEEWLERVHPDDREQVRAALDAHGEGRTSRFVSEHRLRHRDGTYRWVLVRGRAVPAPAGRPARVVGTVADLTEHRESRAQLQHDALHDQLTGLPGRTLLSDRLAGAIARTTRNPSHMYAVLFLDLDRFKTVNDTMGHAAGDELLVGLAQRLTECVRPGDTVARMGGDEFAILLDDIGDVEHATEVASRISDTVARPFNLAAGEVCTSCSIGIATSRAHHLRPEDVLRDADTAMYRAKTLGKSRHQVFDTAMHHRALTQVLLEADLRTALEHDQIRLRYQPVVALADGRIIGLEALVRWEHPIRGVVPQGDFLPLAEDTGLIVPIGAWVIERACEDLRAWRDRFPAADLEVSVNLSGKQFLRPDLVDLVASRVTAAELPAGRLRLEVTEAAILDDVSGAVEVLERFARQAVPVDLDDFGVGTSSLAALAQLAVGRVKVDRAVVAGLPGDERSLALVRAIVALVHSLDMLVVAEGVETPDQAETLAAAACDLAQGFLYATVMDAGEVGRYLAASLGAPPRRR